MTVQIEAADEDQKNTRLQKLRAWITAIDEGMNYDPQEHANGMIRHLWQKVEQLETRVNELQRNDKRTA